MKFKVLALAAVASLLAFASFASPVPYVNSPFSTPNELVNGVVTNVNAALPEAASLVTATATSGAATLNNARGTVTSESLSTAAAAFYTLTVTNASITAASQVFCTVGLGTATTGTPDCTSTTPAAGSVVFLIQNTAASAALNGTIKVGFLVVN